MPRLLIAVLFLLACRAASGQGFSPTEAVQRMTIADGLRVRLVASEPLVRQPVAMNFDDRGRLWVIQYLQYPTPAGLRAVKVDRYLRTVYDKLPEPPPKGPKGIDRITILEDTDGDGVMDRGKDFVSDLNLATGIAHGYGGVFVVQSPYLLFYPDRNGDDMPDGDPEVLLTGFGMEDSHAYANSLTWGPDGWLYGAQGSTVTANIRGISFQQGIWRYHPVSKKFELFAEGGGNTWGLDFDREGNVIAGTNYGGAAMLHQVQGGYYVKGFEKHGPLQNPHTYGYFEHVPYEGFVGGHVTCGGVVYQGGALPRQYWNQYIAANLLSNAIHWHKIERNRSTFKNKRGGDMLLANDTWFRPIDCEVGPDGAVYVADWTDKRANHVDPHDDWDRTNGRVYVIESKNATRFQPVDLQKKSNLELAELWKHPNVWFRRKAQRILAERNAQDVATILEKAAFSNDENAHQAFWMLHGVGGVTEKIAVRALQSGNPLLQVWAIRFTVDDEQVTPTVRAELVRLAEASTVDIRVHQQLACSVKRLNGEDAISIITKLMAHDSVVNDPFQPLLIWWAIEYSISDFPGATFKLAESETFWNAPLGKQFLVERVARRLASGKEAETDLENLAALYTYAKTSDDRQRLLRGVEAGFEGRAPKVIPPPLIPIASELWKDGQTDAGTVRLLAKLGFFQARTKLVDMISNSKQTQADRKSAIKLTGQLALESGLPQILKLLADDSASAFHVDAVAALGRFNEPSVPSAILARLLKSNGVLRTKCIQSLAAKPAGAKVLLEAVDGGKIKPTEVSTDLLSNVLLFNDKELSALVQKHWGSIKPASQGEKIARVHGIKVSLKLAKGDAGKGKEIFKKNCANCHMLFGDGAKIGPELTGQDRKNLDFLLTSIVDPSAVIRREFMSQTVVLADGQILNGLIAESTADQIVLIDSKAERRAIPRADVEEIRPSNVSVMPEKILDTLNAQEIRDLISYLQLPTATAK